MYGNVSYQGAMPVGNNPGNVMAEIMRRLMGGGMGGGPTQYGSPEGEMAMARMLGLVKGGGMQADPRMMGRGSGRMVGAQPFQPNRGLDMPTVGAQPFPRQMAMDMPTVGRQPMAPVPMSKPMGMGLGGGMASNTAMPGWRPQGAQFDPAAVDPRKLALMRARM